MFNVEIRNAMKKARVFGYEVAAALGMNESAFSRKLARRELSIDERDKILAAISEIVKEVQ